jgi:hypothetical protein
MREGSGHPQSKSEGRKHACQICQDIILRYGLVPFIPCFILPLSFRANTE